MHCVDTTKVPKLDQDCSAISFDTKGMKAPGGLCSCVVPRLLGRVARLSARRGVRRSNSGKVIEGTLGS